MRLHSDVCVLFTPPEPGWPSTDALVREELNPAGGGCIVRGQGRLQQWVNTRTSSRPRGVCEGGVLKSGESPENCRVSGDQYHQGTTLCWAGWPGAEKVQGFSVGWVCILNKGSLSIREKYPILKRQSLASHPGISEHCY